MRAIFFEEDDARRVATRLQADGFAADVERERLAGEDDDEDHPWAVVSDAPDFVLEVLVDQHDGWLDRDAAPQDSPSVPPGAVPPSAVPPGAVPPSAVPPTARPLELPDAPRRVKRPDLVDPRDADRRRRTN